MLILTRRKGQTIRIGNDITIIIMETKEGRVRIGIDAPRNIDVVRSELLVKNREELQSN